MFRNPVCCTAYDSPSYLWLQYRWDGGQGLKELILSATQYAVSHIANSKNEFQSAKFHLRDRVLVRPNDQELWFRGRIIGISTAGWWPVRLIDFGDRISVPDANLLPMPERLQQPLGFAVLCNLARVNESRNVREAERNAKLLLSLITMATEDLILEADFDWAAYTSEEEPIPVELYQRSGQSINDVFGRRTNTLLRERPSSHAALGLITGWHTTALRTVSPVAERPVNRSWEPFDGRISHVADNGTIFVQWDERQVNGLQDQLQLFYESEGMRQFSSQCLPGRDEIFAVFQGTPDYHYRGRVLETFQQGSVRVLIVDFGFDLTVKWNQCARIPKRIRYEPLCRAFAPIGLDRVPIGTSLGAMWKSPGAKVAQKAKVTVTPNLEASGPELQAAQITIQLGNDNRKDIVDFLLGLQHATAASCYPTCQSTLQWDVDNIVCGTCTYVESNHVWYIQPTNSSIKDTITQVDTLVINLYASSKLDKPALELMRQASANKAVPVLVNSSDGRRHQRGAVDRWIETTQSCDLTYVDTGERASGVPLTKLFVAPEELINLPATCVRCNIVSNSAVEHAPASVGETRIFSIVGIEEGAYQMKILGTN